MKKMKEYQKPFLEEYPYFGVVVEGDGTGKDDAQGDELYDSPCGASGVDNA